MFFQPTTEFNSESIRSIQLNPKDNQVIVEYTTSAKQYLYENVNADAICEFFFGEYNSVGKFVNAYCKGNLYTVVG